MPFQFIERLGRDTNNALAAFGEFCLFCGRTFLWLISSGMRLKNLRLLLPQMYEVGVRSVRQDAVTVKTPTRDAEGQVTGEKSLETHRNRWVIEKREFFEARAAAAQRVRDANVPAKEAIRQHPELVGTYLQMHAAELAAKRFRDPEDRALFVANVRTALAESVARGEPLPAVRLRERAKARTLGSREREPEPTRG